jgi:glycosyltransferase involved in cell wall biosynthesis
VLECLARHGFGVEALCGTIVDSEVEGDPADLLAEQGVAFEASDGGPASGPGGARAAAPPHLRARFGGVPLTVLRRGTRRFDLPGPDEARGLGALFEETLDRFRPDVLVSYGGDALTLELLARARRRGVAVVFALHNFSYVSPRPFALADAVIVPSRFAADYYRSAVGLDCTVLSNLVDPGRVRAERREPQYVTFVNPSREKGVYAFARIADELGRRRPDIPLLVVESRGTEGTLVSCGLDLRARGNVFLMSQTHDPREFWAVTRLCLMPSLWWENQPLVAVEAMINGIPVIASDRGGIPEALGAAGVTLSLPDRLTPATEELPTAEEVDPWVEAVIRLWDDPVAFDQQRRLALAEAGRWRPEALEPQYARFFAGLRPGTPPIGRGHGARGGWAALVAASNAGDGGCEPGLRLLEAEGVRVIRADAGPGLGPARNTLLADALRAGHRALLLVDEDVAFDVHDALRTLARPEPVVAGGHLGDRPPGMYPVDRVGAGFLRVRAEVLRRMIDALRLVPVRDRAGRSFWPFFQEATAPSESGDPLYLDPEETFSYRLRQLGVTLLADTSLRLVRRPRHGPSGPGHAGVWGEPASSWEQVPGFFDFQEVYAAAVREAPEGATFVEVGTLVGRSTCFLGTRIRESGKAIALHAVDTCRGSPTDSTGQEIAPALGGTYAGALHRNILGCGLEGVVVPILTDSVRASRLFPDEGVDFAFIDGDHSYESVTADLAAWWPKIRPGGVLAGHDYRQGAPWLVDVTRAVHDFFRTGDATHPLVSSCWMVRKPPRG